VSILAVYPILRSRDSHPFGGGSSCHPHRVLNTGVLVIKVFGLASLLTRLSPLYFLLGTIATSILTLLGPVFITSYFMMISAFCGSTQGMPMLLVCSCLPHPLLLDGILTILAICAVSSVSREASLYAG
jgi:hypothetical protein